MTIVVWTALLSVIVAITTLYTVLFLHSHGREKFLFCFLVCFPLWFVVKYSPIVDHAKWTLQQKQLLSLYSFVV